MILPSWEQKRLAVLHSPEIKLVHVDGTAAVNSNKVCFGVFEADLQTHELRKSGIKIKLNEQPFQAVSYTHLWTRPFSFRAIARPK